ncbi:hypothetical protein R3P38DRAFT_3179848 [Favolaschia claudopus]|uniref:Uncharacterized protein n=1 Tax=Favolaschia claudopus TaxID=2862362 RepID=A0AAW0CRH0_9AGAR
MGASIGNCCPKSTAHLDNYLLDLDNHFPNDDDLTALNNDQMLHPNLNQDPLHDEDLSDLDNLPARTRRLPP